MIAKDVQLISYTLIDFTWEFHYSSGDGLYITFGLSNCSKMVKTKFLIVDFPSAYNAITRRLTLIRLPVIVSTYYMTLKFPTSFEVGELESDPRESRYCYLASITFPNKKSLSVQQLDSWELTPIVTHPEVEELLVEIPLDLTKLDQTIRVGSALFKDKKIELINFFYVITLRSSHRCPTTYLGSTKPWCSTNSASTMTIDLFDRSPWGCPQISKRRLKKLVNCWILIIRKVHYLKWLTNIFLIKKNRKWCMCVDYTSLKTLNKACLKDNFPLPQVD